MHNASSPLHCIALYNNNFFVVTVPHTLLLATLHSLTFSTRLTLAFTSLLLHFVFDGIIGDGIVRQCSYDAMAGAWLLRWACKRDNKAFIPSNTTLFASNLALDAQTGGGLTIPRMFYIQANAFLAFDFTTLLIGVLCMVTYVGIVSVWTLFMCDFVRF